MLPILNEMRLAERDDRTCGMRCIWIHWLKQAKYTRSVVLTGCTHALVRFDFARRLWTGLQRLLLKRPAVARGLVKTVIWREHGMLRYINLPCPTLAFRLLVTHIVYVVYLGFGFSGFQFSNSTLEVFQLLHTFTMGPRPTVTQAAAAKAAMDAGADGASNGEATAPKLSKPLPQMAPDGHTSAVRDASTIAATAWHGANL